LLTYPKADLTYYF